MTPTLNICIKCELMHQAGSGKRSPSSILHAIIIIQACCKYKLDHSLFNFSQTIQVCNSRCNFSILQCAERAQASNATPFSECTCLFLLFRSSKATPSGERACLFYFHQLPCSHQLPWPHHDELGDEDQESAPPLLPSPCPLP